MPQHFDKDEVLEAIASSGRRCRSRVSLYLVGGGAMALRGDKQSTKDVDLVVRNDAEAAALILALTESGFSVSSSRPQECVALTDATVLLESEGMRVDLFVSSICGALVFSDGMARRAEKLASFDAVTLYLASREDIFLLKSVTERPRDLDDMIALYRGGLRWRIILDECHRQSRFDDLESGRIWEKALFDKIEEMERAYEIRVPWKRGLMRSAATKTAAHYILRELRRGPMTVKEIADRVGALQSDLELGVPLLESAGKVGREPFAPFRLRLRQDSNQETSR